MPLASSQRWVSGLVGQQLDEGRARGQRRPRARVHCGAAARVWHLVVKRLAELILSVFRDEFDREENARFDAVGRVRR